MRAKRLAPTPSNHLSQWTDTYEVLMVFALSFIIFLGILELFNWIKRTFHD